MYISNHVNQISYCMRHCYLYVNLFMAEPEDGCIRGAETCRCYNCLITSQLYLFNPLNVELNSICHFIALVGAHHILHIIRVRVNK